MKILQVINDLSSGGAQKLLADFVPLMKSQGHEIEVLLIRTQDSIYIDELRVKEIIVNNFSINNLYGLFNIFKLQNYIKKGKFDIVHVHLFPSLYFAGIASLLGYGSTRLVYTEHNTYNRRREIFIFKYIDRFIYNQYDRVIAITPDVKKALSEHLKCNDRSIDIINNGIVIERFRTSSSIDLSEIIQDYQEQDKIVCMVGRFSEAKDQPTLIRAISLLPKNVKLLLIGEGPLEKNCISLSKELNIQDRVHFLGLRKDIPEILKACEIGVLSSNWEGMPLFALEVFATGIPFIGSNVPGIADLFIAQPSSELILFNNKNSFDLSQLISLILKDELAKRRNIEICSKIVGAFSIENMTNAHLDLYRQLQFLNR